MEAVHPLGHRTGQRPSQKQAHDRRNLSNERILLGLASVSAVQTCPTKFRYSFFFSRSMLETKLMLMSSADSSMRRHTVNRHRFGLVLSWHFVYHTPSPLFTAQLYLRLSKETLPANVVCSNHKSALRITATYN